MGPIQYNDSFCLFTRIQRRAYHGVHVCGLGDELGLRLTSWREDVDAVRNFLWSLYIEIRSTLLLLLKESLRYCSQSRDAQCIDTVKGLHSWVMGQWQHREGRWKCFWNDVNILPHISDLTLRVSFLFFRVPFFTGHTNFFAVYLNVVRWKDVRRIRIYPLY